MTDILNAEQARREMRETGAAPIRVGRSGRPRPRVTVALSPAASMLCGRQNHYEIRRSEERRILPTDVVRGRGLPSGCQMILVETKIIAPTDGCPARIQISGFKSRPIEINGGGTSSARACDQTSESARCPGRPVDTAREWRARLGVADPGELRGVRGGLEPSA
jgi:hypothetical protein